MSQTYGHDVYGMTGRDFCRFCTLCQRLLLSNYAHAPAFCFSQLVMLLEWSRIHPACNIGVSYLTVPLTSSSSASYHSKTIRTYLAPFNCCWRVLGYHWLFWGSFFAVAKLFVSPIVKLPLGNTTSVCVHRVVLIMAQKVVEWNWKPGWRWNTLLTSEEPWLPWRLKNPTQ